MPLYHWRGIDLDGKTKAGVTQAYDQEHIKTILLSQQIALQECSESSTQSTHHARWSFNSPRGEHITLFFEQLALLVRNGIDLTQALTIGSSTAPSPLLRTIIQNLATNIAQGNTFYQALSAYPKLFEPEIIHLIATGEQTGQLANVLQNISDNRMLKQSIKRQLLEAALGPLIALGASFLLVGLILLFIVPSFESLYQSLGKTLPPSTTLLLHLSHALHSWHVLWVIALPLVCITTIWGLLKIPHIKTIIDRLILSIPLLSPLIVLQNTIACIQTMNLFVSSGLSLTQALDHAHKSVHNSVFKQEITDITHTIAQGKSLSESIKCIKSKFIEPQWVALIQAGEHTGTLDLMFKKIEAQLTQQLLSRLKTVTAVFSPLLMIIVGVIIGGILIVLYIPIFNLGSLFKT
jgi:type IV pilus assembly protein PilC